jgi:uncharacterized repeat protein (TIGR01451 family)
VTKTQDRDTFAPGVPVTYTVTYTNAGAVDVPNVPITDIFGSQDVSGGFLTTFWRLVSQVDFAVESCTWSGTAAGTECPSFIPATASGAFAEGTTFTTTTLFDGTLATFPAGSSLTITYTALATYRSGELTCGRFGILNYTNLVVPVGYTNVLGRNTATRVQTFDQCADVGVNMSVSAAAVQAGDPLTYTITVSNASAGATATNVDLSDVFPAVFLQSGVTCTAASGSVCGPVDYDTVSRTLSSVIPSIGPNSSVTIVVTGTAGVTLGTFDNTATATSTEVLDPNPVTNSSKVSVRIYGQLTFVKNANSPTVAGVGDTITYSFTVTNTVGAQISGVGVRETVFTGTGPTPVAVCPGGAVTLDPNQTIICTATYTVTQGDVDACSPISNTAVGIGKTTDGNALDVDSPESTTVVSLVDCPDPALGLVKSAEPTSVTRVGEIVTYTFTITNVGGLTITDPHVVEGTFTGTGPLEVDCSDAAASIAPRESTTCTAAYEVTQADFDAGRIDNTATATGKDPGGEDVDSPPDDETVTTFVPAPLILPLTGGASTVWLHRAGWVLFLAGGALAAALVATRRRTAELVRG